MPKVIAFFLPQYHAIPENNEWWGDGFTEWTNVKKAKIYFEGQNQPRIPLDNNYYNLLDKKTVEWQTELANKYNVYGLCYFHYDFGGKRLLETPAENLLKWKEIGQRFCFAWANVTWARTWEAVHTSSVTTWSKEHSVQKQGNGILIRQIYGDEKEWENHFYYLLPFFLDNRYIKENGKPVFLIYHVNEIPHAKERFKLWNKLAQDSDLPGIHLVSMNEVVHDNPYIEAIAHYSHGVALSQSIMAKFLKLKRYAINACMQFIGAKYRVPKIWDYEFVWKAITDTSPYGGLPNYAGAVVGCDDTPRHGEQGTFFKNASPQIFEKYMEKQLLRASKVYKSEYVFLDSWNEWGEGSYLEPDQTNGYAYLEALSRAVKKVEAEKIGK